MKNLLLTFIFTLLNLYLYSQPDYIYNYKKEKINFNYEYSKILIEFKDSQKETKEKILKNKALEKIAIYDYDILNNNVPLMILKVKENKIKTVKGGTIMMLLQIRTITMVHP